MHTEEQAKERWCPFALSQDFVFKHRQAIPMGGPHNRLSIIKNGNASNGQNSNAYCIASKCMAWRWANEFNTEQAVDWAADNQPVEQGGPGSSGNPLPKPYGYCGLAGQPS